jgi:hypothetical protein
MDDLTSSSVIHIKYLVQTEEMITLTIREEKTTLNLKGCPIQTYAKGFKTWFKPKPEIEEERVF